MQIHVYTCIISGACGTLNCWTIFCMGLTGADTLLMDYSLSDFFSIHSSYCDIFSPSSASFVLNFFPLCFSPSVNGKETKGKKKARVINKKMTASAPQKCPLQSESLSSSMQEKNVSVRDKHEWAELGKKTKQIGQRLPQLFFSLILYYWQYAI